MTKNFDIGDAVKYGDFEGKIVAFDSGPFLWDPGDDLDVLVKSAAGKKKWCKWGGLVKDKRDIQ